MMGVTLFIAFYPPYIPERVIWLILSVFFQFLALSEYQSEFMNIFLKKLFFLFCSLVYLKLHSIRQRIG